ncbi:hypothetical protein [Streptomyces sp. NPDC059080]|uniref:hypothetical protein n=1 Tax=Streptomyces sp. NPDC059080 TaxID=3346718 RepID=UPI0036896BA0
MSKSTDGQISHRDKEGRPLDLMAWTRLHKDLEYRVIAEDEVAGHLVRTVWEGIDDGVQVACMWANGISSDGKTFRTVWEGYWPCTQDEAKAAHRETVATLRAKRPADATRRG